GRGLCSPRSATGSSTPTRTRATTSSDGFLPLPSSLNSCVSSLAQVPVEHCLLAHSSFHLSAWSLLIPPRELAPLGSLISVGKNKSRCCHLHSSVFLISPIFYLSYIVVTLFFFGLVFSPICFDMIEEAYMTKCGHSFCYKCIHQSLEDNNRCPKCNYVVDNIDHLYPNFLVNELILKQKQRSEEKRLKLDHSVSSTNGHRWQIIQDLLGTDQDNLDLANVNLMLELLVQKKKQLEAESHAAQLQILMEFLKVARRNKREQLEQIQKELSVLEEDIKRVEEMSGLYSPVSEDSTVPQFEAPSPSHSSIIDSTEYSQPPGFSGSSQTKKQPWYNSTLASRRKRLTAHFEDLEQCYFSTRMTRVSDDSRTTSQLDEFQECLSKFTRYNSVRPLATLSYASDLYNGSSIVS
ncbi:COP1 ligase, partial [Stercorarius parasiticus]|nr:COP1 ligase [Stercorarius parasiticus]